MVNRLPSKLELWVRFPLLADIAQVAQLVEQRIENPCVDGSNPSLGISSLCSITVYALVSYARHLSSILSGEL